MGVKKQMDTFFASLGEQTGYNGRLVNTPMGPFRWNDTIELWENVNNGMVMNNISFMDEFAMMDYGVTDGGSDVAASNITVLEFDFTTGILPSVFTFYRNSIGTYVESDGYLAYSKDNLLPNTVFAGATGTTNPTSWNATNLGLNTYSLSNKELTLTAGVSAARFFIGNAPISAIPGVPYTLQCSVVDNNLSGNSRNLNEIIGWGSVILAGSEYWTVNGILRPSNYTGWTNGDLITYTAKPSATTNFILARFGLGISSQIPTLNSFITIKNIQLEAGVTARAYIENPNSYSYFGPRFTYDGLTKQPLGLLLEGRGMNFAPNNYSEIMLNWGSGGQVGATSGNTADPFGGTAAIALYAQAISGVKGRNMAVNMTNLGTTAINGNSYGEHPFTVSVFARPNNYSKLSICDSNNSFFGATFDLITGSATALSGSPSTGPFMPSASNGYGTTAYTIPHVGTNGITWWRCVVAVPKGNCATIMSVGLAGYTSDSTMFLRYGPTYIGTGVVNDGVYIFGAQFELGYGASSFIPTGITGAATPTLANGITRESDAAQIKNITPYNVSRTNNSLYISGRMNKTTTTEGAFTTLWGLYSDSSARSAYDILTYPFLTKYATRVQGPNLNVGGTEEPGAIIYKNFLNTNVKMASSMSVGSNQISFFSLNGSTASASHANTGDTAYIPSRLVLGQPVGNSAAAPYLPPNNSFNMSMSVSGVKYYNYTLGNTAIRDLTL